MPILRSGSSSGAGARTVRVSLSLAADAAVASDEVSAGSTYTDVLQRFMVKVPVSTSRWRLRIANRDDDNQSGISGTITLADTYLGVPAGASGSPSGNYASAPTKVIASNGQTFGGATEYVSPWVTDSSQQFDKDVLKMLSVGTVIPTNQALSHTVFGSYGWRGAGASASSGNLAPTGTAYTSGVFFDIRVEYEYYGTAPLIAYFGDSILSGGLDDQLGTGNVRGPSVSSWPALASNRVGAAWVNAGKSSALASEFAAAGPSDLRYSRFDFITSVPDVAVIAFGVNDAKGARTVAQFLADIQTIVAALRAYGIPRIVVCTPTLVSLHSSFKSSNLLAGVAAGATSITTNQPYASGDVITLDRGQTTEETVTTSGASTGSSAPYTTAVPALSNAHSIGATVGKSANNNALDYVAAIMRGLQNVDDVVDLFSLFSDPRWPNSADPRWYGVGTLHPWARGHQRIANAVAGALRKKL